MSNDEKETGGLDLIEAFAFSSGTTTRLEASPCPICGKALDAATGVKDHVPEPGDLSVCIGCTGFLRFDDTLVVRALTEEEFQALPPEIQQKLREARDLMRASRIGVPKRRGET